MDPVLVKDMQNSPPISKRTVSVLWSQIVAQCSETNEKKFVNEDKHFLPFQNTKETLSNYPPLQNCKHRQMCNPPSNLFILCFDIQQVKSSCFRNL